MRLSHLVVVVGALAAAGSATSAYARSDVCKRSEKEIAGLFDRWNASLQTGDAHKVVANYASKSVLLPTVSNQPRVSAAEKEDYFEHFLQRKPVSTGEASRSTATPPSMPVSTPSPSATAVSSRRATPSRISGTASNG